MALLINGRFLSRPVTGVERYGNMLLQVVAQEWPSSRIVVPGRWSGPDELHGLEIERVGGLGGHAWEQLHLPRAVGSNDVLLSPANTGPLGVRNQAVVIHDLATVHHPEWFDRRFVTWYGFLLPRLARRTATTLTVSNQSKLDLCQTYELRPDRVQVVAPFARPPEAVRTDPGIGSPYYLMVASRDPRKGYDRALEWFSGLSDPQFKFVIVGRPGPAFKQIGTNYPDGVIHLTGVTDGRLSALYKGAIALAQPSRFEGFGLPVLEALAHGCPVIASDLPVFREQFGDAIHYAEIGPNRSMVDAVALMNKPTERAKQVTKGLRKAAMFSIDRTAKELHHALDPLLNT